MTRQPNAEDASTPLTQEEREQLIPSYVALRAELNEAEQANILVAEEWAFARRREVLNERFLTNLHRHMFDRVWRWAGEFRRTDRNLGIDAHQIPQAVRDLINDCRFWIEHSTYQPNEIAARFHHRLVFIHPFPNGNGRQARLATDVLLVTMGHPRFSWGRASLTDPSETRRTYVNALRAADNHDIEPLLKFVRS